MQIHIKQDEGITHGIKRALEQNNIDTAKIDSSIWAQVMEEVSHENNTRTNGNKIYEGGSDIKGSYNKNFVVKLAAGATEKIIELAQNTWNKIVALVTGNKPKVETPVKQQDETPVKQQDEELVKQQDETPVKQQDEERVKQQDETPVKQQDEERVKQQDEIQKDDGQKQSNQEQIKQKINNLKPGETFTYQETISGFRQTSPVKFTRNADGTLSKVTYQLNGTKFSPLTTTYSQNGKIKSQQEISTRFAQAIVTKEYDEDGHIVSISTDLSNYKNMAMTTSYKLITDLPKNKAKEQIVKNDDGQIIVTYKDGQFYNAKGKQITRDKAYKILNKAYDKKEIAQLIEQY